VNDKEAPSGEPAAEQPEGAANSTQPPSASGPAPQPLAGDVPPPGPGSAPPPGQMPMGIGMPPQPAPPRKSKAPLWILLGVLGLVLVCCIGSILVMSNNKDGDKKSSSASDPKAGTTATKDKGTKAAAGLGTPVRDGTFEFVARKVECGRAEIGPQLLEKSAQGQYQENGKVV
jgi:hypothetical protein